jgi:hypothetical protein
MKAAEFVAGKRLRCLMRDVSSSSAGDHRSCGSLIEHHEQALANLNVLDDGRPSC